jgi:hypothetical protein
LGGSLLARNGGVLLDPFRRDSGQVMRRSLTLTHADERPA